MWEVGTFHVSLIFYGIPIISHCWGVASTANQRQRVHKSHVKVTKHLYTVIAQVFVLYSLLAMS